MKNNNVLVIDTATEACSVAVRKGDDVLSKFAVCPQEHSKRLLPMVDDVLREAGLTLADVDVLGVGAGPGSFTGVRIAMGMAQGLAFGGNIPVVPVSTLQAMAQETYERTGASRIFSAIDARMSEVYFAEYSVDEDGLMAESVAAQVLPPEQVVSEFLLNGLEFGFAGTGWQAYPELADKVTGEPLVLYPSAEYMLPYVERMMVLGKTQSIVDIEPLYLRDKVTWKKLPGRE